MDPQNRRLNHVQDEQISSKGSLFVCSTPEKVDFIENSSEFSASKSADYGFMNLDTMKFMVKLKSKSKTTVNMAEELEDKLENGETVLPQNNSNITTKEIETDSTMRDFIAKAKDVPKELSRHFIVEQLNMIEAFEKEKEGLRNKHEREKNSIKKAYENERKDLLAELEKAQVLIETNYKKMEDEFERKLEAKTKELKQTYAYEVNEQKRSLHEQWILVGEIELEIQRIAKEILLLLQTISPKEASNIDSILKSKLAVDKSCLASLRKIFQDTSDLEGDEKNAICLTTVNPTSSYKVPESQHFDLETTYNRDLDDLTNIFRQQKSELMEMFAMEKEELKKRQDEEKRKLQEEMFTKYQLDLDKERKEWQETIRECQREIDILRFQRDQMDRNYCIELDNMKMEFESEKVYLYKKFMSERDDLKKNISDQISHALFADVKTRTIKDGT